MVQFWCDSTIPGESAARLPCDDSQGAHLVTSPQEDPPETATECASRVGDDTTTWSCGAEEHGYNNGNSSFEWWSREVAEGTATPVSLSRRTNYALPQGRGIRGEGPCSDPPGLWGGLMGSLCGEGVALFSLIGQFG